MLKYEPNKRPTASECLQHEYFKIRVAFPLCIEEREEEEERDPLEGSIDLLSMSHKELIMEEVGKAEKETKPRGFSSMAMLKDARYRPGVRSLAVANSATVAKGKEVI